METVWFILAAVVLLIACLGALVATAACVALLINFWYVALIIGAIYLAGLNGAAFVGCFCLGVGLLLDMGGSGK